MKARRLGKTDIFVSPVIFGGWAIGGWYWGGTDDEAAIQAIRAAIDSGITAIDTAPIYGRGHSERVIGRAIHGRRDQVTLMTKVGLRWDDQRGAEFFPATDPDGTRYTVFRNLRPDSIRAEVERSLARLGVDVIDVLQCHWPDPTTPIEETMGAMASLIHQGKVRAIGVSNFNRDLLERARKALLAEGDIPLASNQPPYSLLNRQIEDDVLPWCQRHDIGVVGYSPLERGLLSGAVTMDRVFPDGDGRAESPMFQPVNRRLVLEALLKAYPIAQELDCSPAQLVIAWVHKQPGLTAALVGARTPAQARENAAAGRIILSDDQSRQLADIFATITLEE